MGQGEANGARPARARVWTAPEVAGWLGILGPVAAVATWAAAGVLLEGYNPVRDAISELGALDTPTRPAINAALILFGLGSFPLAAAIRTSLPGAGRALYVAMVVTGLATIAIVGFPCSNGCPGPTTSVSDFGHAAVATIGYMALVACPFIAARGLRGADPASWAAFRRWSLAAGVLAALAIAVWASGLGGSVGGAWQRGGNTLADVWWASLGVTLVRRSPQR